MYGYVYKLTNLVNGKIYIGKRQSEVFDETYYGSGTLIPKAIEKYSIDNFSREVLCWYDSEKSLRAGEEYWIQFFVDQGLRLGKELYNLKLSSVGGDTFSNLLDDVKEVVREKHRKVSTGRKHSEATKLKMSKSAKSVKKSDSQIAKQKESLKSRKFHWYTNGQPGKENNLNIPEGEEVPEGFYPGRTYSSQQKSNCGKCNKGKKPWNKGLTKETDSRVLANVEAMSNTKRKNKLGIA